MIMMISKKKIIVLLNMILILSSTLFVRTGSTFVEDENVPISIQSKDLTEWWWSDIELLSDLSDLGSYYSDIKIDNDGNIHVIWLDTTNNLLGSGADSDLFYIQRSVTTQSWSSLELVSEESTNGCDTLALAVDTHNRVHVVWKDDTDYLGSGSDSDIFYKRRDSSGVWTTAEVVSTNSNDEPYSPTIDVDITGNPYIFWSDRTDLGSGADTDIWYNTYDFQSSTWLGMTLISPESITAVYSPCITVDSQNNIHLAWADSTNLLGAGTDRDIVYKKYDAGEASWSSISIISTYSNQGCEFPQLDFDSQGKLHAVWSDQTDLDGAGVDYDLWYSYFDESLSTWKYPALLTMGFNDNALLPRMKIDTEDYIHVTWFDASMYAGSGADYDVYYAYCSANGVWSDISMVTPDSDGLSEFQNFAIDNNGFLHFVWYDYTSYLSSGSDADIFYRKFVGSPGKPILFPISPPISSVSNISLTWSLEIAADSYDIYRSPNYFTDESDLAVLDTTSDLQYFDALNESGTYFYAVVAINEYGDSDLSNVVSIEVPESTNTGLFASIDWGEILILGGFLGVLQMIFAIVIIATKSASKPSSSAKKGKNK